MRDLHSPNVCRSARDIDHGGQMAPAQAPRPPVRRVLVFVIVAVALVMMAVDGTIVATALDAIQAGLDTSINWAAWTITAYSFGFLLMLPISSKLTQRYGQRRVFLASVAAFTAASLCCALVDNIYALIALRALQAAGGAGFTPSATGIVVDHFGDWRDRAVSLFGSIFPIGAMIGPIFGGLFVTYWSWRGVFLINLPLGLAVLVLGWRHVPHDRRSPERTQQPMDLPGLAMLGTGVVAGMLAISYLGEPDVRLLAPGFVLPTLAAILAWTLFIRHIHRAAHPFLSPRFIHGASFAPVNLVNILYGGVTSGAVVLIPLYAANRYGLNALDAGTLLIAQGAATVLVSVLAALALRRTGHRAPLYAGSSIIALGLVLLALPVPHGLTPYAWLAGSAFFLGAGRGAINPASRNAGLQLAPRQSSTLAALRTMCGQTGSITTISIATAILASVTRPGLTQAWIYLAAAALLVLGLPLITRVAEHHGKW